MNNLRLQLAEFNNFLIKNYLQKLCAIESHDEPVSYLIEFLKQASSVIGTTGQLIGDVDFIDQEDMDQLSQSLKDSTTVIYLIEHSINKADLVNKINGIHTYQLSAMLDNITAYGKKFNTNRIQVEQELKDFYADNSKYIRLDGSFIHQIYYPTFEEALNYLNNNSTILRVKNTAAQIMQAVSFFKLPLKQSLSKAHLINDRSLFFKNLLTGLTVVLLALTYAEPFFEVSESVSSIFELSINEIMASQDEILGKL